MKRRTWVIGTTIALGVLTGISTSADDDIIIHGCLNNAGHLRLVSGPSECKRNETPTWWNETGPHGPQGDVVPPGVSGYEIVTTEWRVGFEGYETKEFFCQCPGGKYVLGGGARIWVEPEYVPVVEITGSYPTELGEWCVEVTNTWGYGVSESIMVFAECVQVGPSDEGQLFDSNFIQGRITNGSAFLFSTK